MRRRAFTASALGACCAAPAGRRPSLARQAAAHRDPLPARRTVRRLHPHRHGARRARSWASRRAVRQQGRRLGHDRRGVRQEPAGRQPHLPHHDHGDGLHHPPPAGDPVRSGEGFRPGLAHVRPRGASSPSIPRCRPAPSRSSWPTPRPTRARSISARQGSPPSPTCSARCCSLEAGIKMVHVPYRGSAPATNALLAGEVQAQFDQTLPAAHQGGQAASASPCWPRCAIRTFPTSRPCARQAMARTAAIRGSASWRPPARRLSVVDRLDQAIADGAARARRHRPSCTSAACA